MGNAMAAGGGGRKAKVMKINGEVFKLSTPAKAGDIIKDYPGHVLIDSDDFLRFNLRAQPLGPQSELRTKKIYLLVQLPRFPALDERVLRRTSSGEITSAGSPPVENLMQWRRRSSRARSVKVRLLKAEVDRIVEQSRDDVEAAERIIDLCMEGERAEDETTEEVSFSKHCINFHSMCTSYIPHHHAGYKKLTKD